MSAPATPLLDLDSLDQGFTDPDAQSVAEGKAKIDALRKEEPVNDAAPMYDEDEDETDEPDGDEDETESEETDAEEDGETAEAEEESPPAAEAVEFNPTDPTTWDSLEPHIRDEWKKQTQYSQALA